MGRRTYDDDELLAKKSAILASGGDTFARTTAMRQARPEDRKCHEKLSIAEPYRRIRECRDSETHPESNAVACFFDVTGSQEEVPRELEANLRDLMGYFLRSGYLSDVAVFFGAVGDSTCDKVPLQVGQFEPGAEELMNFFQRVYLEGGGGGQNTESYQNAIYFMARHTALDCLEKRGKKGYLFITGDELPYDVVNPEEIKELMGGTGPEAPIPTSKIVKEAQEKYIVFFIIPLLTSGGSDRRIWSAWQSLLGKEHVLGMERTEQICELVGTTVGVCEGKLTVEQATENLRRKGFGEKYLAIAKSAYDKKYDINKDTDNATKPVTGTGVAGKKDKKDEEEEPFKI